MPPHRSSRSLLPSINHPLFTPTTYLIKDPDYDRPHHSCYPRIARRTATHPWRFRWFPLCSHRLHQILRHWNECECVQVMIGNLCRISTVFTLKTNTLSLSPIHSYFETSMSPLLKPESPPILLISIPPPSRPILLSHHVAKQRKQRQSFFFPLDLLRFVTIRWGTPGEKTQGIWDFRVCSKFLQISSLRPTHS